MMLYDANLQNLKRCVRNNEAAPDFDLGNWTCGTYGCLVGNDFIACRRSLDSNDVLGEIASPEYGLSRAICTWLFQMYEPHRNRYGLAMINSVTLVTNCSFPRPRRDRRPAIDRVAKLIAYIERKRAIWYEADGRISERARRQSGNWNVCASVLSSIAVSA